MKDVPRSRRQRILPLILLVTSGVAPALTEYGPSTRSQVHVPDDHMERIYDLRAIMSASALTPPNVDLSLHLSSGWVDTQEPGRYDVDHGPEGSLSFRRCIDLIHVAVEADERAEITEIVARAGRIQVKGNEAAQSTVRLAIEALQLGVLDAVSIEVYRLDGARVPRTLDAVLDQRTATKLLSDVGDALATHDRILLGRAVLLGDSGRTTFLSDYDTEHAPALIGADPVISAIAMGIEIGVRIDRAADGRRFIVRTWGRDGELFRPIPMTESQGAGTPKIERPRVATSLWVASAIVEPGGAFVIEHGGGGESALILRIPASGVKETPRSIIPLGELALPPLRPGVVSLSKARPSGGDWLPDEGEWFHSAKWSDGTRVTAFLENDLEDLYASGIVSDHGPVLLLPSPAAVPPAVREAIERLRVTLAVPTIMLDVRYDILEPEDVSSATAADGIGAFAAGAAGRVLGAAVEGDALLLVGGKESAYLCDHDSLISMGGPGPPDPIVAGLFEGVAVWCAPLRNLDGGITAWFDVQVQVGTGTPRKIDTLMFVPASDQKPPVRMITGTYEKTLSIELPVTHRARARTFVRARDGAWALVTARPLAGTGRTLVVVARMSLR